MAQQLTTFSVTAPGFWGLNTQDSPVDMDPKFALEANNCVIDKSGRVGARKGWTPSHVTSADITGYNVECIGEVVANDGTRTIVAAGNGKLFKITAGTPPALDNLVTLTYGGGGAAPTISTNNWQFITFNGAGIFFQRGYDPLIYDPSLSTTAYRRISEHPSYAGTVPQANCALAAFGRVWCADTSTDKNTVTWSDTLTYQVYTGGTSGSLNLLQVWPKGGDEIVALAQHNNNLIIFGTKQILIYNGADDPSTMKLADSINIGCVGRDTVANTGDDVLFLSDTGVRGVLRTIQEKSAPLRTVSRNVNDDIQAYIENEGSGATIKAIYSPFDSFYLLTFVNSSATYCFDMRTMLQDGSARASTWTGLRPKCYCYAKDRTLYVGQSGYVGEYDTYYDNGATYRMSYYTSWIDFGNPVQTSILKKINMTLFGTINQTVVYKWGFDYETGSQAQPSTITDTTAPSEYGIAEYGVAEYSRNLIVTSLGVNAGGVGKVVQIGFECQLQGYPISVQRVDVMTKEAAYK